MQQKSLGELWGHICRHKYKTIGEIVEENKKRGTMISRFLDDVFINEKNFPTLHVLQPLKIVTVSPLELGFDHNGGSYPEICKRGVDKGLILCPAFVAPMVLLQESRDPFDGVVRVAMHSVTDIVDGKPQPTAFRMEINMNDAYRKFLGFTDVSQKSAYGGQVRFMFVEP